MVELNNKNIFETFLNKEINTKTVTQDDATFNNKSRIEMLAELGLHNQINSFETDLKAKRLALARQYFTELSTYEIYLYKTIFGENTQSLADYEKERIPDEVIQNIYLNKQKNIFEHLELWQPSLQIKDPVLVGIIEKFVFVLGIWGEPKINIQQRERELLGNLYKYKDQIKTIINQQPITSLSNPFDIMFFQQYHEHCPKNIIVKGLRFIEQKSEKNHLDTFNEIVFGICPECNEFVKLPNQQESWKLLNQKIAMGRLMQLW